MIFRVPTGLPDENGRIEWRDLDVECVHSRTLGAYLVDLGLPLEHVSHVIIGGKVMRPEERVSVRIRGINDATEEVSVIDAYYPRERDEIHIVPRVEGKNTALILGVVGGVIGFFATGGASLGWTAATLQGAMAGYAIGSTIGQLITPKPKLIKDGDGPTSYLWNGIANTDGAGGAVPIMLGERLVGGHRISAFRRRPGVVGVRTDADPGDDSSPVTGSETLHLLILVAGHKTWGPVGITNPNVAANTTTNKPDIRINGQHYSNFGGLKVDWRTGAPSQPVLKGFDVIANTYDMSVDVTAMGQYAPHTYTTASDEVEAFEVLLTFPGLSHTDSEGRLKANATRYSLEYKRSGTADPWTNFDTVGGGGSREVKGATRATAFETRRAEGLPKARYDIRIMWTGAEHTDATKDQWHVVLTGVTEERQEQRNYEGDSLIAVYGVATDQLSGMLPTVTSVWRGYEPQKWNGSSFDAASWGVGTSAPAGRNPYWLALALMRDRDLGLGNEIPDSDIDLPSFKAAAEYAGDDPLIGTETVIFTGGSTHDEPRFQFDAYLDRQQAALDLMQQIVSSARGALIFSGNKWRVAVDRPGAPTQLFNMGNIKRGSMNLQFKSERGAVNVMDVTFDDAEAEWETDTLSVCIASDGSFTYVDPIDGVTKPWTESKLQERGELLFRRELQLLGGTRRTQAIREGRFALRQVYALREYGSFGASTDSILAETYDLINIAHDLPQWGYSGRVLSGSEANLVMFDRSVPFEAGTDYQVMVRFNAGDAGEELIETRTVADVAPPADGSEYFGLFVTEPFSQVPQEGDLWVFGPTDTLVRPARIIQIDRDADEQRVIAWAEYNESIYDLDGPIDVRNYSLLPDFAAPPGAITSVVATEEVSHRNDGSWISTVILQWARPIPQRKNGYYRGARIEYSYDSATGPWIALDSIDGVEYRWQNAPHGVHIYFRVTPYSASGAHNYTGAGYADVTTQGLATDLPVVTGFTAATHEGAFLFSWVEQSQHVQYELRTSNPANWKTDSSGFVNRVRGASYSVDLPPGRSMTLYIRAVDAFGNYSSAANTATATDAAPSAPTIAAITPYKQQVKVRVAPPAGVTDVVRIYLHASQTSGFTPSSATLVSGVVGPAGGEFVVPIATGGTWYFKATCADWLTERMNDWVYSAQTTSSIIVVAPVDPTAVTLTPSMSDGEGIITSPDGQLRPQKKVKANVSWAHNDTTNDAQLLEGFEVTIWDSSKSYTEPLAAPITINDRAARLIKIDDVYVGAADLLSAVAGVKALYADGYTSNLVTSAGQTISLPTNPSIRDSDDRQITGYAESFDGSALPTGFSVAGASSYSVSSGFLGAAGTVGQPLVTTWDLSAWAAAYLDTTFTFNGNPSVIVRFRVYGTNVGTTAQIEVAASSGGAALSTTTFPIIRDGEYHTYLVDAGRPILPTDFIRLRFGAGVVPSDGAVQITAIAIATESVDQSLDGTMDRAIRARNQFGRDVDGRGFFLQSPIRNADENGNIQLVNENGIFYLTANGTETAYKRGRTQALGNVTNNQYVSFNSVYSGTGFVMEKELPIPTATNKTRILLETTDAANDQALFYPLRRFIEATEVTRDQFRICALNFHGGTPLQRSQVAPSGGWSPSDQQSSAITKTASYNPTVNTGSAWYNPFQQPGFSSSHYYYRYVVGITVLMPTRKKANGSFYAVDTDFYIVRGTNVTQLNPMLMDLPSSAAVGPFRMRTYTDGKEHTMFVVLGPYAGSGFGISALKIDWIQTIAEAGRTDCDPTWARLTSVSTYFMNGSTGPSAISTSGMKLYYLEEF